MIRKLGYAGIVAATLIACSGAVNSVIDVTDAPYNAVCDGTTDDGPGLQAAFNYAGAHYLDLKFPTGICRTKQTLRQNGPGAVLMFGTNIEATSLRAFEDITVLDWGPNLYGRVQDMSIIGYMNTAATQVAVHIENNASIRMDHFQIWGGVWALYNAGNNGVFNDGNFAGWSVNGGGVFQTGANNYTNVYFDQDVVPTFAGLVQGYPGTPGSSIETTCVACDFSGNYQYSLYVDDGGTHQVWMKFLAPIFSRQVLIANAQKIQMIAPVFGSNISNAGVPVTIVAATSIASSTAVGGPYTCAANTGLVGC